LPSQRTLRDYTYITKAQCGFSDEFDEQLMENAKISDCEEKDKYIALLMDEMHMREDIVCDTSKDPLHLLLSFQNQSNVH